MGEAKRRGTYEQRKTAAIARNEAVKNTLTTLPEEQQSEAVRRIDAACRQSTNTNKRISVLAAFYATLPYIGGIR